MQVKSSEKSTWTFELPWAFPDKVMPDIDFTDEAVVECDAQVAKKIF